MEPLAIREGSAKRLAIYLVGIAGVAFIGASEPVIASTAAFGPGALFGAHLLLMGLALVASVLEWTRERLGESAAIPVVLLAFALTLIDAVMGVWYFAPFLGIVTLLSVFALANRYMVRDEGRHAPRIV